MSRDVFPTLFGALRDRLAADVGAKGSNTLASTATVSVSVYHVPSNALLASILAPDTNVHQSVIQGIRHEKRLQVLQRKRLSLRKMGEAKRKQQQTLQALAVAECDMALQDASMHDEKFQYYVTETHFKAAARLQCTAEIKKALDRMESVAADATEESESMVNCQPCRSSTWFCFKMRC
ncbi:hypothetical protein PHMEG_00012282 [Phytophthora megakarya]|uniref:Uncharacterized protein n=1 Tax=Phytophthora megakarya TaxID=4795 RepID=A0A225W960_9STRA|nr:hypothetical protein PHMEG_00012282 [Phytophthora megakarya]